MHPVEWLISTMILRVRTRSWGLCTFFRTKGGCSKGSHLWQLCQVTKYHKMGTCVWTFQHILWKLPNLQLGKGKFHLVGVSCVPGTRLDSFYAQWMYSSWHLLSIWNLFFTGEKTDGQGGRVTCLSLHVSKWQSQDWNQLASSALTLCFIF